MGYNHGMHLTTFEPLNGLIITAECFAEGWHMTIRHRHHSGLFTDCDKEEFERLTSRELEDALLAVVSGLHSAPAPADWAQPEDGAGTD